MQTFICPICGATGEANDTPMVGVGSLWVGECSNNKCYGNHATEVLSHEGDLFPVDEWRENYD